MAGDIGPSSDVAEATSGGADGDQIVFIVQSSIYGKKCW